MKLSTTLLAALALPLSDAFNLAGRPVNLLEVDKRAPLQNLVTWDDQSLFIRGERVFMFSGEFHPFRLPVPSLYLDIFQKIRALGFNMVSFYVDWALLEGKPGEFRAQGIFDLEPFFEAAKEAGIYLLARPGPYINAEVSGGGFPGWLQRIKGVLRTDAGDFLSTTDNYMANICAIIAKHQITQGGPVVLFQPENEYSYGYKIPFPNGNYMQYVVDQARQAGIVVPMINNDIGPAGNYAPGSGRGAMDIYGHDSYPLGFDCANPSTWPADKFVTNFHRLHMRQSPSTPFSLIEFQGGSYDPWGGHGLEQCSALINHEFERVYYKNNIAAGVRIFSVYMIFGGTNWGNLGHPGGYTSYDYGACIRENGVVDREKYSELKLEAEFLRVSPGYLVTTPGNATQGVYSANQDITVTPLLTKDAGGFFVVRHTNFANTGSTSFTLRLPTSAGRLTIPQSGGGALTLLGRDSKVLVTDYPVGDYSLLYSSAEVFTWKKFADKTVLVLYGGVAGETHEFAVHGDSHQVKQLEGDGVLTNSLAGVAVVVKWKTTTGRQVVKIGHLVIHLLDRNSAYKYWVPVLPSNGSAYGSSVMNPESLIVNGGYLVRSATIIGSLLSLKADFNASTSLEIMGVPPGVSRLSVNGRQTPYSLTGLGDWMAEPDIGIPKVAVPDLKTLSWRRIDSLPEIQPGYDDSAWPVANKQRSSNTAYPSKTAVSLYGSDYGFHSGTLVFRGHFSAQGNEAFLKLVTSGGSAFASSVWLDDIFIGSFKNAEAAEVNNSTYRLPTLSSNSSNDGNANNHVLTIVVDSTGLNEVTNSGTETMKAPRGILDYALFSSDDGLSSETVISPWKITGNLGGEDYVDKSRGPLNEGGLFFERQGLHLPSPPASSTAGFVRASPWQGFQRAGISFYVAPLTLNYPSDEYDIPLSFVFDPPISSSFSSSSSSSSFSSSSSSAQAEYRATLYINGFQYGKYSNSIGPQSEFPVPEGILNYRGTNWIGLAVWALDPFGAVVPTFRLKAGTAVVTGRHPVRFVKGAGYSQRSGAY